MTSPEPENLGDATQASNEHEAGPATGNELSRVVITLCRGVLYRDAVPALWQGLLRLEARVRDYVAVLGLELVVDEPEGYAYLKQKPDDPDDSSEQPRLVARRPLSYPVSLLLALLRKRLAEQDAAGADTKLVVTLDQIVEQIRVFLPDTANEARLIDRIETHINKAVELGMLRRLRGQDEHYEVQRILKAFVDAQWLGELEERLRTYRAYLDGPAPNKPENP